MKNFWEVLLWLDNFEVKGWAGAISVNDRFSILTQSRI